MCVVSDLKLASAMGLGNHTSLGLHFIIFICLAALTDPLEHVWVLHL